MSYLGKAPAPSVSEITDNTIVNADISSSAAIAQSKLSLSITDTEVDASAAIAQSKLNLSITNSEISSSAAIDDTKVSPPYYAAVANFPTASDHHGRIAHAHSEGAMYYSHGGSWVQLADNADLPTNPALLASTQTFSGTNTFSAPARGTQTTDNDGSFDLSVTNNFKCTPSGNITLTFTNPAAGQSGNIYLDNSGGHTVSSASATKIAAADLTTISAAGLYWLSYYTDGTNILVSTTKALT